MTEFVDPSPTEEFPDRPDHPHFRGLSHAVQAIDSYVDEGQSVREVLDHAGFDAESLIYMAKQRAKFIVTATTPPDTTEELIATMAAVWIDGFLPGLMIGDGRSTPEITQVLMEDGQRRTGRKGK
jgi:hypothetical protein